MIEVTSELVSGEPVNFLFCYNFIEKLKEIAGYLKYLEAFLPNNKAFFISIPI
jgi:hypothetical protein